MVSPVSFRWPAGLVERVDLVRGDVPRTVWVRRAVERALEETKPPDTSSAAPRAVAPTPAEQPRWRAELKASAEELIGRPLPDEGEVVFPVRRAVMQRSSAVRRDVKPFQRGGS